MQNAGIVKRRIITESSGIIEAALQEVNWDEVCGILLEKFNVIRFTLVDHMIPETPEEAEYLALIKRERELLCGEEVERLSA